MSTHDRQEIERAIWFGVIIMSLLFNGIFSALNYTASTRMLEIFRRQEQREKAERQAVIDQINANLEEAGRP